MKIPTVPKLAEKFRSYVLLLVVGVFLCALSSGLLPPKAHAAALVQPLPLISRGVPAYGTSNSYPPSNANDASYDSYYYSSGPSALSYDLSGVPAAQRGTVELVWYNDASAWNYGLQGSPAYSLPQNYTVDVNSAPGGTVPTTGWVTVASATNNQFASRAYTFSMTGYNWVRLNVTSIAGSLSGYSVNMDVYNAANGTDDGWAFTGDSITAGGMGHATRGNVASFAQLVNQQTSAYFPLEIDAAIGGWTSANGAANVPGWLPMFPGKFVTIDFGTNDANACVSPTTYYNNMASMVQAVLNAGKTPAIPTIPYGLTANIQNCGPQLNAEIQQLYGAYPQIVHGPDFWTFFKNNQQYISSDQVHPNDAGFGQLRQQWANTMVTAAYNGIQTPPATAPSIPTGLQSTATTSNSISLAWNASSDTGGPGLAGYKLYRNGTLVTTTSNTSFTDTGLAASTSYSYTVSAYDTAGNESAQSNPASASTSGTTPPSGQLSLYTAGAVNSAFTVSSYGTSSSSSCDTTLFTSSPCSYGVTYTAWGGLDFQTNAGTMNTSSYGNLVFNVYLNNQPLSDLSVLVLNSSGGAGSVIALSNSYVTGTPAAGWVTVSVPVSVLNPTNIAVKGIRFRNTQGQSLSKVNFDDLYFQ